MCRNTSGAPSAGETNPKPFSGLNHLIRPRSSVPPCWSFIVFALFPVEPQAPSSLAPLFFLSPNAELPQVSMGAELRKSKGRLTNVNRTQDRRAPRAAPVAGYVCLSIVRATPTSCCALKRSEQGLVGTRGGQRVPALL